MLSRFANEVLSHGASAILPQNLSTRWLQRLQKHADDFLDNNFAVDQCTETVDTGDPVLVACVHEALGSDPQGDLEMSPAALAEHVVVYSLSLTMESIRRETDIEMTLPTLDNLLSIERITQFGKINPDFGHFLARACIAPEGNGTNEANWFSRIKKKIKTQLN
jgi:hypothetical protein